MGTSTLESIGKYCQNLKELELDGQLRVAARSSFEHLTQLRNLRTLKLVHNNVSDKLIGKLVKQNQGLVRVSVAGKRQRSSRAKLVRD